MNKDKRKSPVGLDWLSNKREEMSVYVFERGGIDLTGQRVMDLENINEQLSGIWNIQWLPKDKGHGWKKH